MKGIDKKMEIMIKLDFAEENVKKYFKNLDFITVQEMFDAFSDLITELEFLKEEFEDYKQDVEDNFERKKNDYDFYGLSEKDFF